MAVRPLPPITATDLDAELTSRVERLTLAQKIRLLTGADFWSIGAEPAIGLRRVVVSDGPSGVRGELWDERDPSASLPSPTALAATWDEARVEALGSLLAAEARRKGIDVLLAPTVNLHRSPYGGRHFECFSEDPQLSGTIGAAFVRGVQSGGVAATVKHFVANDSETERRTLDARVDERVLQEIYLAPFEAMVRDAQPWAMIAAYNRVNGHPMTESPLLTNRLKGDWGFDGVVMSDWFATCSIEATANAGLDLAMPGPHSPWVEGLGPAVSQGRVDVAVIDAKVLRLLRLAARVGALDGIPGPPAPRSFAASEVAAMVRGAAAASFVLAQNNGVLPLERAALRRVAVLGPNAAVGRIVGGGSATVFPPYTVSPLDGLRAALGDGIEVTHSGGVRAFSRVPVARSPWLRRPDGEGEGLQVRFFSKDGALLATEQRRSGAFTWLGSFGPDLPLDRVARIEVHTRLRATDAGEYTVGVSGVGKYRLTLDGRTVLDADVQMSSGADDAEAVVAPPQRLHGVRLEAGQEVSLVLVHDVGTSLDFGTVFQLNLEPPHGTDDQEIERAVALARDADVAVVVVGTTEDVESEGFDRTSLALPGRQDDLVREVAAANPRTVVVVNAGAPVLLPWADEVAAVLLVWFPGQEFGNALADVLLGITEPGGRLPTTWPATEERLPSTLPVANVLRYDEGLLVGYRGDGLAGRRSRYPFGHGLGYTTWQYDRALGATVTGDGVVVHVMVRNTGTRDGREVVQVYLSRPDSAVSRPLRWLAAHAAVHVPAGGVATLDIAIPSRAFAHWDVESSRWVVERGTFEAHVGPSSRDLRSVAPITVD